MSGECTITDKKEMASQVTKETKERSEDSSSSGNPPPYEEIEAEDSRTEEEEKILSVLKDVVKKTTLANPLKRPSASQVVKMLEDIMPRHVLSSMDQFDVSDDDDDDDDDRTMKGSRKR